MTAGAVPVPPRDEGRKKSLIQLIGDLPGLVGQLIRDEIEQIKKELTEKLTKLGVGAGLFAGAAFFGFFGFAVLVTTAILALALVLPAWLAALIVAVLLLLVTGALAFLGLRQVKKGVPPVPEGSIQSVKEDVRAFKGMGKYDR
ncbi:phage holin family protein [Naasia sp. SYSU D00057]|uniref:phage holin family protein n=1 Tax=Naasia sp. SYSU D00057 TaxID=2817380 RepID=UPI001B314740|nr:phage holin family protein [Naasia sp. SYSU D00057]